MENQKEKENEYRITIIDTVSFGQIWRFQAGKQIFVLWGLSIILIVLILCFGIVFATPLRKLLPATRDYEMENLVLEKAEQINNLRDSVLVMSNYMGTLRMLLSGDTTAHTGNDTALVQSKVNIDSISFAYNDNENQFRARMEREEMYSLLHKTDEKATTSEFAFYVPVKGYITSKLDVSTDHYGIDIVCKTDEMVHAALSGTVVLAEFSLQTGYILGIQHDKGYLTFYKHNSKLLKKVGDKVVSGDAIAVVGNTGEETSGPHLHFELWKEGKILDPLDYIHFEK